MHCLLSDYIIGMGIMKNWLLLAFSVTVVMLAGRTLLNASELKISQNGKTEYCIVKPDNPTKFDDYALSKLAEFMKEKTTATFPVVSAGEVLPDRKYIFVGLSASSLKFLGKTPLQKLEDQEYVARSIGENIFLYGKGMRGNLDAVVDFMENSLGRRWYSGRFVIETPKWKHAAGKPVFEKEANVFLKPFSRKGGFSFTYRLPAYDWMFDFHFQNGMNIFGNKRFIDFSRTILPIKCHTLFSYITPSPKDQGWAKKFSWVEPKNYFETNPEYFGMNQNGKRDLLHQLCFSNNDLRSELTKKVLKHIGLLKDVGKEEIMINVSAMDTSSEFCFCPGCQELKKKYQSLGGPLYDYLFELCGVVKEKHPGVMLHTLAYRLSQTQKPPVMLAGQKFPENLAVMFASIHDKGDVDWTHPNNKPNYEDLLNWCKIAPHVWVWYYPFNGMINRMVNDIRLMKKAGVEGVFVEFTGGDYNGALNFTELQIYIYNKLLKDVNQDVTVLIKEFTDYQYGPAAEDVWIYLREMETAWAASSANRPNDTKICCVPPLSLSPETIRHWHKLFEKMERLTADDSRLFGNIRRLRRGLDYRTLKDWNDLSKADPDYFKDYLVVKKRLGALPVWAVDQVEDWEMAINTAGKQKPLPQPFASMDKTLVKRFVPERERGWPKKITDPDAAFGYASVVNLPDKPFNFGFYQDDTKTHGAKVVLEEKDIKRDIYAIYKLGEIEVTPKCKVWFSARSWLTKLELGNRLYSPPTPDNDNRYDAYASLKFTKPIPPTAGELRENNKYTLDVNAPYTVLCDQIIFVKKAVSK